jgi:hypothetical protein
MLVPVTLSIVDDLWEAFLVLFIGSYSPIFSSERPLTDTNPQGPYIHESSALHVTTAT